MKTGYYLCGVTSQGAEEEENLFNELYDKFSHNELSVHEVIQRVADFQGFDLNEADIFKEDYSEDIYTKCFTDGDFILSYDNLEGSYNVYLAAHELKLYSVTFDGDTDNEYFESNESNAIQKAFELFSDKPEIVQITELDEDSEDLLPVKVIYE